MRKKRTETSVHKASGFKKTKKKSRVEKIAESIGKAVGRVKRADIALQRWGAGGDLPLPEKVKGKYRRIKAAHKKGIEKGLGHVERMETRTKRIAQVKREKQKEMPDWMKNAF